MRQALRHFAHFLTVLLAVWSVQSAGTAGEDSGAAKPPQAEAQKPSANRFDKQRHDEIMASPGREECQIAFIGDSITFGWSQENGGKTTWDKEFVPLKAMNLGVVCDTTDNVLWRLDAGDLEGMKNLKVVVLHIGTNDIGLARRGPEAVAAGVTAVIAKLKEKAPQAKILLMGITPKGRGGVDESNALIAKLDDGKIVFYQNINEAIKKTPDTIADRVGHLKAKGYEVWATEIRPTILKLMK